MDPERGDERGHTPGLSLWPIGVAVGIACILVGLIVSWWIVAAGGAIALAFTMLWILELMRERAPAAPAVPQVEEPRRPFAEPLPTSRKGFLSAMTLGLGAVIGGIVTVPPLVFAGVPPFVKDEGFEDLDVDLGPLDDFPQDQWLIAKFNREPNRKPPQGGDVARRTAYIRYNGLLDGEPSFTVISNRCVHLGCPVQANGPVSSQGKQSFGKGANEVELTPVLPAGFGCPCHGGQYDTEGNRTAGPPVRALDRYAYSIRKGHLFLTDLYSVNKVRGSGMDARIGRYRLASPGLHLDGWEQIFYPILPPS